MAIAAALLVFALGAAKPCCGEYLSRDQARVLKDWLAGYPTYRVARDEDDYPCPDLSSDLPVVCEPPAPPPDHPYQAVGDFNGDGVPDFAVILVDTKRSESKFALVVFNGPLPTSDAKPAFFQAGLKLGCGGLQFGPPRKGPYLMLVAPLEFNGGGLLVPSKATYRWTGYVCE